uniref:Uncharacterized protein n=1 Tax=Lepeophtheirus salmonis TaxID=72036 RepID=A0A0K2UAW1_LEPSM
MVLGVIASDGKKMYPFLFKAGQRPTIRCLGTLSC